MRLGGPGVIGYARGWFGEADVSLVGGLLQVETTQVIRRYDVPNFDHVKLWDFPGAGTPKHPLDSYFADKMLYALDCLICCTSTRFTEADLMIMRQVRWLLGQGREVGD